MLSKIKKFLVKRKDKNIKIHIHKILHVHRICPRSFFRSPILQKWLYYVKFFFCTYIHFIIARIIITILLLLYLLRSIQLTTLHPPLANRLSYLFDTLPFLFVVPSPTKWNKRTKKEKEEKPLCRKIRTQFSVFPMFSQLWECRLKSIRGSSVKGREKWKDKRFTFLDKTANSIWSDHCNETRAGRK